MCAYKLVTVKFKWWGMQTKMENFIHKVCEVEAPMCEYYYLNLISNVSCYRRLRSSEVSTI